MNEPTTPLRRVEPTVSLLSGAKYVPADRTNVAETWRKARAELLDFNDDEGHRHLRSTQ